MKDQLPDGESLAAFVARTSNPFSSHFTLIGSHTGAEAIKETRFAFSEWDRNAGATFVTAVVEAIQDDSAPLPGGG